MSREKKKKYDFFVIAYLETLVVSAVIVLFLLAAKLFFVASVLIVSLSITSLIFILVTMPIEMFINRKNLTEHKF